MTIKSVTINYSVPELTIDNITNDNGTFYRISVPGHTPTFDPGKPELPVLSRLIDLPEGYTYKITISDVTSSRIVPSKNAIKGLLLPSQYGETKQRKSRNRFL